MTNKIFNFKNFESFLTTNGDIHSFDHNDEADYLLSNMNSPKNSPLINNTLLNKFEGWMGQNPLYKFPNENTHWDNHLNENTHEILLKYLNSVNFDRNAQTFDDCKFLDYILNENLKESKVDNLNDATKSFEKLKFTESKSNLSESKPNLSESKPNLSESKPNLSERITKYENGVRGRVLGFEDLRVEKVDDFSSYIIEGTGTILKIIEASQLWLNHTSSEKIPLKIKKQFTKNDNFVILIKKQSTHY